MYKITYNLKTGISFTFDIVLDAIIAARHIQAKLGFMPSKLEDEDFEKIIADLPLKKNNQGYCTSIMFYDKKKAITDKQFYSKRFDFINSELIEGATTINTKRGEFKDCKIPIRVLLIDKVHFYFDTDNIEYITALLESVSFLGKKSSQGFGEITDCKIEKEEKLNFDDYVLRPVPFGQLNEAQEKRQGYCIEYRTYKMPYHDISQATSCYMPNLC